jgi:hypothetical protein
VVNDLGGAADGGGSSAAPAEEVVEEIKTRGGTGGREFRVAWPSPPRPMPDRQDGRPTPSAGLDGVVNNAGILRDMPSSTR